MSVTLRLARRGNRNRPIYRIVAIEKARPRDGRFLEVIGNYNPLVSPPAFTLKEDRVKHWISQGAEVSKLVSTIIKKQIPGYLEEITKRRLGKKQAARKARKARIAKSGAGKAAPEKSAATKSEKKKAAPKAAKSKKSATAE